LRESIIHNKGVAKKEVEKCKVLKWFEKGDEITIDRNMFKEMVRQIYKDIGELQQKYCDVA
jgi:hypothetical protein